MIVIDISLPECLKSLTANRPIARMRCILSMKIISSIRESLKSWRRWLVIGIGVKRWLVILAVGAVLAGIGIGLFLLAVGQQEVLTEEIFARLTLQFLPLWLRILLPIVLGGSLILVSILRLGSNLVAPFRNPDEKVVDSLYSYSQKGKGPNIVAIGGGTGLPSLLRGLKQYTSNITAIVTVADDGGSSGRLRKELGLPPPGDFRNNIAALARDEALMTQLLQYRFGGQLGSTDNTSNGGELQGHAFGNLLLAALSGITGSFDEALVAAGRVLAIGGRVLPSTLAEVTLIAQVSTFESASLIRVEGESSIPKAGGHIERLSLEPPTIPAYPPSVQAILQADAVVIGPGSLYTSILPNLLVTDIARALHYSNAIKIYVCNLATQPGETDNYSVADHVTAIDNHLQQRRSGGRNWVDLVVANRNLAIPAGTGGGNTIFVRPEGLEDLRVIAVDLVDDSQPWRHDSSKLSQTIMELIRSA
jgi:uncharacterized cofD-like protein